MSAWRVFAFLVAGALLAASPAEAQRRQQQQAARAQSFQSGDVWVTPSIALQYRIDERWSFHLDTQGRFDTGNGLLRDFQARPGFEYALSPNWAVAAGYVQFTRYLAGQSTSRGPFQDILYRARIEELPIALRWRWEELFFDSGQWLVRTRLLAGVRVPLQGTPWELAFSDEVFLNVANSNPNTRLNGFTQNRAFAGFGRQLTAWSRASLGYELDTFVGSANVRNVHNIKFSLIFNLN
jgi:hypothetical protein